MSTIPKLYSLLEASQHSTKENCWIVINGKVYDVTKFLDDHPGGDDVLLSVAGRDSTKDFEDAGHSATARSIMEEFAIGELDTSPAAIAELEIFTKLYSMQEASQHSTKEDCWIVISGKVYDVTKFLDDHPGGDDVLLSVAGRDSTEDFEDVGHSDSARELMEQYAIGELDKSPPTIAELEIFTKEEEPSSLTHKAMDRMTQYWVMERFQELFSQRKFKEAAELAADSPGGILRTPEVLAQMRSVPVQGGETPPLLLYFGTLLTKGKLNAFETLELSRLVVNQNRMDLLENWLSEDKLECSEELGDLVNIVDNDLALKIYIRARVTPKVIAAFAERMEFDKIPIYSKEVGYEPDYCFLLQTILRSDPQGAVNFALMMSQMEGGCPIDYNSICDLFLQRNLIREATAFLLDVLKPNLPEHGLLQTKLLEINLVTNPNVADDILANGMFSHYDRPRIGRLCEKASLYMRALQHYTEPSDIKRVIVKTHAIEPQTLVEFFRTLSRELALECMKEIMLVNSRENLQIVVQAAKVYSDQYGVEACIKLFEQFKSYEGLYLFLGSYLSSSEDQDIHFKYIEAAAKTGHIDEVERVTRESNFYDAVKTKNFLMEAKLLDATPLKNVSDRLLQQSDDKDSLETRRQSYGTTSEGKGSKSSIRRQASYEMSSIVMFSKYDIECATDGLRDSSKIGQGGYGGVYRGYIGDTEVAIKMLDSNSKQGIHEFLQEMEVLGQMRHPNLVKLIGACVSLRALVYEFLPNGSLGDCLRKNPRLLTWQMRTRIIHEICSALTFLHSRKPPLVHGDLKPANILLNASFNSKLADFGLCRFLPEGTTTVAFLDTMPKGTLGYIDPEFMKTGILTSSCDLYSYGVTILRLLTGMEAVGIGMKVRIAYKEKTLMTMVDRAAGNWPTDVSEFLAYFGLKCCAKKKSSNLIKEIARDLEDILADI